MYATAFIADPNIQCPSKQQAINTQHIFNLSPHPPWSVSLYATDNPPPTQCKQFLTTSRPPNPASTPSRPARAPTCANSASAPPGPKTRRRRYVRLEAIISPYAAHPHDALDKGGKPGLMVYGSRGDLDHIDKQSLEISPANDEVYSSMQELADELPDHSPRFVLLSYPLTLVVLPLLSPPTVCTTPQELTKLALLALGQSFGPLCHDLLHAGDLYRGTAHAVCGGERADAE